MYIIFSRFIEFLQVHRLVQLIGKGKVTWILSEEINSQAQSFLCWSIMSYFALIDSIVGGFESSD